MSPFSNLPKSVSVFIASPVSRKEFSEIVSSETGLSQRNVYINTKVIRRRNSKGQLQSGLVYSFKNIQGIRKENQNGRKPSISRGK